MDIWEITQVVRETNYNKLGKTQIYKIESRLCKLKNLLEKEPPLSSYSDVNKWPIEYKMFSPNIRKSVNEKYSHLYAAIARAFHCKLIWAHSYEPSANSSGLIKTFIIWGPHWLLPIVNNACKLIHDNIYKFNKDESKRLHRYNKLEREKARKNDMKPETLSTIEQMKNHHTNFIDPIIENLYDYFMEVKYYDYYAVSNKRIENHVINRAKLHWKLWALASPNKRLYNATARKNKFHKNRLIAW